MHAPHAPPTFSALSLALKCKVSKVGGSEGAIDVRGETDLYGGSPRARGTARSLRREPQLLRVVTRPGAGAQRQRSPPPWFPHVHARVLQSKARRLANTKQRTRDGE
jgi:hypothetical protein